MTSDHSHISDKIRKSTDLLSGSMRGEGGSGGGGISQSAAAASTSSSTSAGNDDTTGSINDSRPVTVSGAGPIIHATSPLHDAPATSFSESVNSMRSVKDALPSSSSYSTAATSHYQQHQISSSTPPNNTPSLVGYSHPSSYPVSLNKSLNIPQPSSLSSSSLGNSPRSGFEFISPSSSRQPSTTTSPRTALGSSMGSGGAGSATLGHPFHHHPTPHNIHHQQQGGTLPQKQMLLSELGPLELLGVRQLAALKLYPIMDGYFTYEELTEMSETRKQRSVWTKMVDVLKPTKKNTKGKYGSLCIHAIIVFVHSLPSLFLLFLIDFS